MKKLLLLVVSLVATGLLLGGMWMGQAAGPDHGVNVRRIDHLLETIKHDGEDSSVQTLITIARGDPSTQDVQVQATYALATIAGWDPNKYAKALLPVFIQLAENKTPGVRSAAALGIGNLGRLGRTAIPTLLSLARANMGTDIESNAARSLRKIGEDPDIVVPALKAILAAHGREPEYPGRSRAVLETLKAFGPDARGAIPELVASLKDDHTFYRVSVLEALISIDPTNDAIRASVIELSRSADPAVRLEVVRLISKMDNVVQDTYKTEVEAFAKDKDEKVAEHAGRILASGGSLRRDSVGDRISEVPIVPKHSASPNVDSKPRLKLSIQPHYPVEALEARIEGKVLVQARVNRLGKVEDVKVIGSFPLLERAAMDAVMQFEFLPASRDGRAVDGFAYVTVEFSLPQ